MYFEHDFDYVYNYDVKVRHCSRCRFSKTTHTHVQADSSRLPLARRFFGKKHYYSQILHMGTSRVSDVMLATCSNDLRKLVENTICFMVVLYRLREHIILLKLQCRNIMIRRKTTCFTANHSWINDQLKRITAGLTFRLMPACYL